MMTAAGPNDTSPRISRSTVAHILMFAAVALWGAMFVIIKTALTQVPPQWFNAWRMIVAFAFIAIVWSRHWRGLTRAAWLTGAATGAAMAAGFFFQTQGLLYTSATNSAFLTALVVVLVPLLAMIPGLRAVKGSRPGWPAWTGALMAFAGVALMTTPAGGRSLEVLHGLNRGDMLTLVCAVGFSLQIIALEHGAARVPFRQLSMLQIGFCMVFLTLAAWVTEKPAAGASGRFFSAAGPLSHPGILGAIITAGVFATAVGFSVQTWAQQEIPATNLAVILTLEPVFAWLTAFMVLHERMQLRAASGAFLVLLGILAAEIFPRWLGRRKPAF